MRSRRLSTVRNEAQSTAQEQLTSKGFILIQWYGKCEADKVSMGTYSVGAGEGGMYGMVFDNTFSKTVSKTATFVLITYPTDAPPNTTHQRQTIPSAMSMALGSGNKSQSPRLSAIALDSQESLHSHSAVAPSSRDTSTTRAANGDTVTTSTHHVGALQKLRRKKGQGYARRYFSLDFGSCTLSYYYNRNSSALRGAIPLSLAAISADEQKREISIDSGAEVWHLKAGNAKDFAEWTKALEAASNIARGITAPGKSTTDKLHPVTSGSHHASPPADPVDERDWEQIESLFSRIAGTRDAIHRLAADTRDTEGKTSAGSSIPPGSPRQQENGDYFNSTSSGSSNNERRPFWRRKTSSSTPRPLEKPGQLQGANAAPSSTPTSPPKTQTKDIRPHRREQSMHDHCRSLLNNLDLVLDEFQTLISSRKRRRMPIARSPSRNSLDSTATGEFYDAESDQPDSSQVMMIRTSDDDTPDSDKGEESADDDSTSVSSIAGESVAAPGQDSSSLFPPKPKSLTPLPIRALIKRRKTVPAPTTMPPSLIAIVRKYVGKDLSTISMHVSANEPTSLLQRLAENLEYADVLDAASQQTEPARRLLYMAAFAVSTFSNSRARTRAIRKPFNPMLGETFELVRGEADRPGNFRFIAEKVSHHPVILACQADAPTWTFSHAPVPTQKFWGKSAEIITEGRVRVVLRLKDGGDECYSWNVATVFLRNVVMGEKYVEPVGTMPVQNETTGAKATIEFKNKGMFGGRSEDVTVTSIDPNGKDTGLSLTGHWTSSLRFVDHGKAGAEIWKVGKLIDGHDQRYGFTEFAASLNEVTEIEKDKMCITDSRLRRDQRALEEGDVDAAEEYKQVLENEQRSRRKELQAEGKEWTPRWFVRGNEGEEVWRLKHGKDGYWDERAKGSWAGVEDVLAIKAA